LLLVSDAIERLPGDAEAALFVSGHVLALHQQARLMGAISPSDHLSKAQAEADRQAAYVRALEDEAGHWELGPGPDPDLGCWGGCPDESSMQTWIGGTDDSTLMN
jgi:hypothetical protein